MFFRKRNARLTFSESKIRLLNRGKFIPISLRSNREIELFDLFFSLYLSGIGRIAKIVNKEKKGHCLLFYFRVPNSTPFFPISKSYFPHLISLCIWKESLSFEAQICRSLFWIFFFLQNIECPLLLFVGGSVKLGPTQGSFWVEIEDLVLLWIAIPLFRFLGLGRFLNSSNLTGKDCFLSTL